MTKKIFEPGREVEVFDECDVLVVGGGAAGHSAAVAAARAGCKSVVLLERYGYMGGDVTGAYVIMVPALTWRDGSFVRGLQEEWFTRLEKLPGAVLGPSILEAGSEDAEKIQHWEPIYDCVNGGNNSPRRVSRSVYFEPNQLKIELDKMLTEHSDSIRVCCHSMAARPLMDGNAVKGVMFESKEGRKAILAKVVIDATGDADIAYQAGAPVADNADGGTRVSTTALVYRVAGADYRKYFEWNKEHEGAEAAFENELKQIAGFSICPLPTNSGGMVWLNNWLPEKSCIKVKDLTATELSVRGSIREIIEKMKAHESGAFKNAYLYDIAPQLGARCSRRIIGDYVMTPADFAFHHEFEDVIAWHSTICHINDSAPVEIPYRAIVPQKIENLLCPGRHLSADAVAVDWLLLIPQCVGMGQAAGVAAAVAVRDGVPVREADIKRVQDILAGEQDVPLPRNPATDPYLERLCKEHDYGLYTKLAQTARENQSKLDEYRQW